MTLTLLYTCSSLLRENIASGEKEALRRLTNRQYIGIVPADKGNATVLMDRDEYIKKVLAIIEHTPFEAVKMCPARQVERTSNTFLWCLFQDRLLNKPLYNQLHASECPLPRFYGLAKSISRMSHFVQSCRLWALPCTRQVSTLLKS